MRVRFARRLDLFCQRLGLSEQAADLIARYNQFGWSQYCEDDPLHDPGIG
ncbi:MAG: hypothetical protein ABJY83_18805 [Roseibium sp.]